MNLSAFKKASVILGEQGLEQNRGADRTRNLTHSGTNSPGLYDCPDLVLVGLPVETVPGVEHVVQIFHLLQQVQHQHMT